ncbi:HK97 family phage prohead protease [Microbacterium oxydans]|nr:HK97 family phage prohead protease [Microbacterium oxydans]
MDAHLAEATGEETDEGLVVTMQFDMDDPTSAKAFRLLKSRRIKEFSIGGFEPSDGIKRVEKDGRTVWQVWIFELVEISLVLRGANPETRLIDVKSAAELIAATTDEETTADTPSGDDDPTDAEPNPGEADEDAEASAAFPRSTAEGCRTAHSHNAGRRAGRSKRMNLKEKLKALLAEAAELAKKGADLSEEDVARVPVLRSEIEDTQAKIKAQEEAAASLKSAIEVEDEAPAGDAPLGRTKDRGDAPRTLGAGFVGSEAMKAFRENHPNGVAKGNPISIEARRFATKGDSVRAVKAPLNTIDNGDTTPTRLPGIEDVTYRRPNTLLDLITVGTTDAAWLGTASSSR